MKTLALIALSLTTLLLVPTAVADPPRDGSGFAVSDDGAGSSLDGLGDGFERLRPKAFRFTVPYDAADVPAELDRAKAVINRAKEVGVTEIFVSFRQRHDQRHPAQECVENPSRPCDFVRPARAEWRTYIRRFMDTANGTTADGRPKTIDDDVTMWSPANEPNAGTAWLTGDDARSKLADYFLELKEEIASRESTDKVVSPEFRDHVDTTGRPVRQPDAICPNRDGNPSTVDSCSTVEIYIRKYRQAVQTAAGGGGGDTAGFGDWLGWQPIDGARKRRTDSTQDFLAATASPANTPVVVTAAAFVRHPEGIIYPNEPEPSQTGTVKWFANSLVRTPRVTRIHYHNMRQAPSSPWDSGLTRRDETVRPAWRVWCGLAHADNLDHPTASTRQVSGMSPSPSPGPTGSRSTTTASNQRPCGRRTTASDRPTSSSSPGPGSQPPRAPTSKGRAAGTSPAPRRATLSRNFPASSTTLSRRCADGGSDRPAG
jgi:hypothetical protein